MHFKRVCWKSFRYLSHTLLFCLCARTTKCTTHKAETYLWTKVNEVLFEFWEVSIVCSGWCWWCKLIRNWTIRPHHNIPSAFSFVLFFTRWWRRKQWLAHVCGFHTRLEIPGNLPMEHSKKAKRKKNCTISEVNYFLLAGPMLIWRLYKERV